MDWIWVTKFIILMEFYFVIFAQNITTPKWQKTYRIYLLRNRNNHQTPLHLSSSQQNNDYSPYNHHYTTKDRETTPINLGYYNTPKHLPLPERSPHQDSRYIIISPAKKIHKDSSSEEDDDFSDEDYENEKEITDHTSSKMKYYRMPFHPSVPTYHSELGQKRYKPPTHYIPGHLYESLPLAPTAIRINPPYRTPTAPPRIYLTYRPSHKPSNKQSYASAEEQDSNSKYLYDSEYGDRFKYPVKTKYKTYIYPLKKPHYSSSGYIHNPKPKYHASTKQYYYKYLSKTKQLSSSPEHSDPHSPIEYDNYQRQPDAYYASSDYAREKNFGTEVKIPFNRTTIKFSRPYPHVGDGNFFVPSNGPEYLSGNHAPVTYFAPLDSGNTDRYSSDSNSPVISGRDPLSSSGSSFSSQPVHNPPTIQSLVLRKNHSLAPISYDDYEPVVTTEFLGKESIVSMTTDSTEIENYTISTGETRNEAKVPEISESKESKVNLPPQCALDNNSSFCFHDTQYPFVEITKSINRNRKTLERLLKKTNWIENDVSVHNNSFCQSTIHSGILVRAKNAQNRWKIIVKLPQHFEKQNYSQIVRMEQCDYPGSRCNASNSEGFSVCSQQYQQRKLICWNTQQGIHLDVFSLPSYCICEL